MPTEDIKEHVTIYVDSLLGDDIANTGSILKPYKTILKAYNESYTGGVIILQTGDGSSYGNLTISKNISIIAAPVSDPYIGTLSITNKAQCLIQGLKFENLSNGVIII